MFSTTNTSPPTSAPSPPYPHLTQPLPTLPHLSPLPTLPPPHSTPPHLPSTPQKSQNIDVTGAGFFFLLCCAH